jgi:hypothetical protein
MNSNTTLFGGKNITVNFEPVVPQGGTADQATVPPPESVKVRQIPVREYEVGFAFVEDEPALVGFLCGQNKQWALTLAPVSYELVLATGREVNRDGFFSYSQRRTERAAKEQAAMIGMMATLPPETLKLAMEKGLAMQSRSPSSSHASRLPQAR